MPIINTTGNPIDKFGTQLPLPYIDRVEINSSDDLTSEMLTVSLSIYIEGTDEDNVQDKFDDLSALRLYSAFVIGNVEIFHVENQTRYHDLCYILKDTQLQGKYIVSGSSSDISIPTNFSQQTIGDTFSFAELSYYDEGSNLNIYQYTGSISISLEGSDITTFESLFAEASYDTETGRSYRDLSVYCFSSLYNFDSDSATTEAALQNYALFTKFNSQISYEPVFKEGNLTPGTHTLYRLRGTGEMYEGFVLNSLDGETYGVDDDTYESVLGAFQSLAYEVSASAAGSDDAEVAAASEGLSYVVEESTGYPSNADGAATATVSAGLSEADSVTLSNLIATTDPTARAQNMLVQMQTYQGTWGMPTTFSSSAGVIYQSLGNTTANADNTVRSQGNLLYLDQVRNPKILDQRTPETLFVDFEIMTPDTQFVEPGSDDTTPDRVYVQNSNYFITRAQYDSSLSAEEVEEHTIWQEADTEYAGTVEPNTLCTYGYIFFDFERALYNDTHISDCYDIDRVIAHFGDSLIKSSFKFDTATLYRYADDDDDIYVKIDTHFGSSTDYPDDPYSPAPIYSTIQNVFSYDGYVNSEVEYGVNGSADYSKFIPRSVIGLSDGSDDTMCAFEFYDYQDIDTVYGDEWYRFEIVMQDYTLATINAITSSYHALMTGSMTDYYDLASEACSYNDVDGFFNAFWVDGIIDKYGGDMINAPWIRAPIVYNMHRDILYNEFGGNLEALIEESQIMTSKIDPKVGTLAQIEAFYEKFKDLWDYFYEIGGQIYNVLYDDTAVTDGSNYNLIKSSPQELAYNNTAGVEESLPDMQVLSDIFELTAGATEAYVMSEWDPSAAVLSLRSIPSDSILLTSYGDFYTAMTFTGDSVVDATMQIVWIIDILSETVGDNYSTVGTFATVVLNPIARAAIDGEGQEFDGSAHSIGITVAQATIGSWSDYYNYVEEIIDQLDATNFGTPSYTTYGWKYSSVSPAAENHWKRLLKRFAILAWPNSSTNGGPIDLDELF
tara:strand:- start:6530 stop:9553 length:3024 start_codon:yes stop_codon:yes gene_type:complete